MRTCACGLFSQASCLAALDEYMAASHFGQISDVSHVVPLFALRFPLVFAAGRLGGEIRASGMGGGGYGISFEADRHAANLIAVHEEQADIRGQVQDTRRTSE